MRKIQAGDVKENILLQNGDMMFVPKASAFFVLGEVNKPGTFPLDKEIDRPGGDHAGRRLQRHRPPPRA